MAGARRQQNDEHAFPDNLPPIHIPDGFKQCGQCRRVLQESEQNFRRDKNRKSGFRARCKRCLSTKKKSNDKRSLALKPEDLDLVTVEPVSKKAKNQEQQDEKRNSEKEEEEEEEQDICSVCNSVRPLEEIADNARSVSPTSIGLKNTQTLSNHSQPRLAHGLKLFTCPIQASMLSSPLKRQPIGFPLFEHGTRTYSEVMSVL